MRRDARLLTVLIVIVILGAAIGWAGVTKPAPVNASAALPPAVPLASRTVVCPQVGGQPANGTAHIAFADTSSEQHTPSIASAPLGPDAVSTPVALDAGHAWTVDGLKTAGPMRVSITGPSASSLDVLQFTRQKIASSLQLSATPCEGPTTDAWFGGFSTGVGAHATLLLSNIDDVSATVDVGIYADDQPPNASADNGIKVAPHSQAAVRLDTLAPGHSNVFAHITTTAGRVVPAIRYDTEDGSIPHGVEWVPPTEAPATKQTVPGILGGDGGRQLLLSAPGDVDASVQLTVVTADGFNTPTGFDEVDVPAGQVVAVDLAPALKKAPGAVVVTSTEPVVAAAVGALPKDKTGGSDLTLTAAAPALSGPVTVPGGETGAGQRTELFLTAPGQDAELTLTLIPSANGAEQLISPLTVPGGTTAAVDLGSLSKDPAPAIEISPDDGGPVYAAWAVQESADGSFGATSFPLRAHRLSLQRPLVESNPLAGLPVQPSPSAVSPSQLPSDLPSQLPSDFPSDLPSDLPSDAPAPEAPPSEASSS